MPLPSKLHFLNIVVLLFALFQTNLYAGFLERTLIKTPQGLIPVECLKVGDKVVSCDLNAETKEGFCKNVWVKGIASHLVNDVVLIHRDNRIFCTSVDQLLFEPIMNQWIEARALIENNVFISARLECFSCTKIEIIHKECLMYEITLEEPHLLFITEQEILAHNAFAVVLPVAAKLVPVVIKGACVVAGAIGLFKLFGGKSKKKHSFHQQNQPDKEPQKDPNNKDNQRVINTINKAEFFKRCSDKYEHLKNGIYRIKKRVVGFLNGRAHYLQWDYLHSDVEAYSENRAHLGSLDPKTLQLYKGPVPYRELPRI